MATLVTAWVARSALTPAIVVAPRPPHHLAAAHVAKAVPVWDGRISGVPTNPPTPISVADSTEMRGHVYQREADTSLTPVAGAYVYAFLREGMHKVGREKSAADGSYVFRGVPRGVPYVLLVRDPAGTPMHNAVVVDRVAGATPLTGP